MTADTKSNKRDPVASTPPTLPRLGPLGTIRWAWRQLTSMRTALFLLLLLAVAAVPGSIWPQRNIDPVRVATYLAEHRQVGRWLDRAGAFDVYSSPWFASIYLLLVVSLVGCVLPRTRLQWRAIRALPPRVPRNLDRLPDHASAVLDCQPHEALAAAQRVLRARRFRVRIEEGGPTAAVSAESGYLRETGNLVFHGALLVLIVAVAAGHLFSWRGDVILPVGQTFSSSLSGYDTIDPGPWVDTQHLPAFELTLNRFDVTFEDRAGGSQLGAPRNFTAFTTSRAGPGDPAKQSVLTVNHPLAVDNASIFLLGNGYAPSITVRDGSGRILYDEATPFLPQDNNYQSVGAVKVTGASPNQLGFAGFFLPSAVLDKNLGPISVFPGLKAPALVLTAWEGNLFPGGRPQSVYSLQTGAMTQLRSANGQPLRIWLTPGATVTLPGGRGSITMGPVKRWAGLSVRHDPGKIAALVSSLAALAGLLASLLIRRRRIFVRVGPAASQCSDGPPQTRVVLGAIAKGRDPTLQSNLVALLASITERTGGTRD